MKSAMEWLKEEENLRDLAIFLDFDGTLAPIVERPGDARPLEGVKELVEELGETWPVAVISGRGLDDVRRRLGAKGIFYAGSHGMEIETPDGERHEAPEVEKMLQVLDRQEEEMREKFEDLRGVEVERKRFGVAIHFRRNRGAQAAVEAAVDKAVAEGEGLKAGTGKMVREIQPDVEWDKGTALRFIWSRLDGGGELRPLYIGDDETDEDAFREMGDRGVGILVAHKERPSAAGLRLDDPEEVRSFLQQLTLRA